jgi:hypothetical protein
MPKGRQRMARKFSGWLVGICYILVCFVTTFSILHVRFALGRALSKPGKLGMAWQKHFLMPACFGWRHTIKMKFMGVSMTIPTRFDVVVIAIYFLLNVIFLITQYDYLDSKTNNKDPLYPTLYKEMLRLHLIDRELLELFKCLCLHCLH